MSQNGAIGHDYLLLASHDLRERNLSSIVEYCLYLDVSRSNVWAECPTVIARYKCTLQCRCPATHHAEERHILILSCRRKASLPSELLKLQEAIQKEDEFDLFALTNPSPPAILRLLFDEVQKRIDLNPEDQFLSPSTSFSAKDKRSSAFRSLRTQEEDNIAQNGLSSDVRQMADDPSNEVPYSRSSQRADAAFVIAT